MLLTAKLILRFPLRTSQRTFLRRQLCSHSQFLEKYCVEQLKDRGLLRVRGNEASTFLQGLVTNDMKHLEEGAQSMYAMFLNIKGRVICDAIIYQDENAFLIESDKTTLPNLQKHLKMYRVRKKIDIDITDSYNVWTVYPNPQTEEMKKEVESTWTTTESPSSNEKVAPEDPDKIQKIFQEKSKIICRDPRLAELGYRLIIPNSEDLQENMESLCQNQTKMYRTLRYMLGVGEGPAELPPGKCIPLEVNCDYLHGVSFHKGCYIGQELTARAHHTGVVRKRLMPIFLNCEAAESYTLDTPIENALDKKTVGKLRGLEKNYGLGLLRVNEALSSPALSVLNVTGFTAKPAWWPQEARKDRSQGGVGHIDVKSP